jgi:Family of unknown function (DUF5996)
MNQSWPPIPYREWKHTCTALHLWSQIIGKYRLARTPWVNHSWHATLYVHPRGLTTASVPDGDNMITITFDFLDHALIAESSNGERGLVRLEPMSVADFFGRAAELVEGVGGRFISGGQPNETESPIRFAHDRMPRPYDRDAVERFHRALVSVDRVFRLFRTGFIGKGSPSHLFWGSFDLAVTRFSGRAAPIHPGGVLNLPDTVTREAYSHEVSSAGFWPGGSGVEEAMFYSYAYPATEGFKHSHVEPVEAGFNAKLGEFLLPYDTVRTSLNPEETLMRFLQTTYAAAADTGDWDRKRLECRTGRPGVPRELLSH